MERGNSDQYYWNDFLVLLHKSLCSNIPKYEKWNELLMQKEMPWWIQDDVCVHGNIQIFTKNPYTLYAKTQKGYIFFSSFYSSSSVLKHPILKLNHFYSHQNLKLFYPYLKTFLRVQTFLFHLFQQNVFCLFFEFRRRDIFCRNLFEEKSVFRGF